AVAAQAAVPADPLVLEGEEPVLRAEVGGVQPDQLVSARAAGEQLPVEPGPEPRRLDGPGKRAVRAAPRGLLGHRLTLSRRVAGGIAVHHLSPRRNRAVALARVVRARIDRLERHEAQTGCGRDALVDVDALARRAVDEAEPVRAVAHAAQHRVGGHRDVARVAPPRDAGPAGPGTPPRTLRRVALAVPVAVVRRGARADPARGVDADLVALPAVQVEAGERRPPSGGTDNGPHRAAAAPGVVRAGVEDQ